MSVPPPRGIDHVVLAVHDLEAARREFAALGFTLTPRAEHPFGTDNCLIQLRECFIELLTVARPKLIPPHAPRQFSFAAFNRDFLAKQEGLAMLVFDSRDAAKDRDAFAAAGLPDYERFDFSRQAGLPDGRQVTVGFSLAFATDPGMPEAAFFTCQQHAPEHFWKPDYQRHGNGAYGISEIVMVAAEPAQHRAFFNRLQGAANVRALPEGLKVATTRGTLSVVTPTVFERRYPGFDAPDVAAGPRFGAIKIAGVRSPRTLALFGAVLELTES